MGFGPLFLRDDPDVRKAGVIMSRRDEYEQKAEALLLSIDFSPEEIEMIDEKLDLYYKFSNKYGQTEQEMLDYLEKAKERRNSILFADEELNRLNEEYENLLNITVKLADKLSVERKKTAKVFEEHANEIFDEAENRLHAQKAVLVKLLG